MLSVIGRLPAGSSPRSTAAALTVAVERLERAYPEANAGSSPARTFALSGWSRLERYDEEVWTLAGLLAWQGVIIRWIGSRGVIGIQDHYVNDTANYFLPKPAGWIVAAVLAGGFALSSAAAMRSRRRAGLPVGNVSLIVARVVFVAGVSFGAVDFGVADSAVQKACALGVVRRGGGCRSSQRA